MGDRQTIRQLGDIAEMLIHTIDEDCTSLSGIIHMINTACGCAALELEYGHISEREYRAYLRQIQDYLLHMPLVEPRRRCRLPWLRRIRARTRPKI